MTAIYHVLAGLVVVLHLAFVLFVVLGGLAVWRRPRLAWAHLPAVAWGIWIEASGGICPLTPIENALRQRGGAAGYTGGFVEHYLLPALYPEGLTRWLQAVLAAAVLVLNGAVYWTLLRRRHADRLRPAGSAGNGGCAGRPAGSAGNDECAGRLARSAGNDRCAGRPAGSAGNSRSAGRAGGERR
jgi:hypothetical protein